jgi:hypothetical protein
LICLKQESFFADFLSGLRNTWHGGEKGAPVEVKPQEDMVFSCWRNPESWSSELFDFLNKI